MGNCVARKNRVLVQNEEEKKPREAEAIKKRKSVRFKVDGEDESGKESHHHHHNGYSKSGVVRIRLVVTQRELIQILRGESKYSSVEQLLSAMKVKSRKISQVRTSDDGANRGWRPALESIPEDQ